MNHLPYRAIALDLDGTLTNHDKVVTPKTREALLQAEAEGVVIILASGRPTYGIEPVAECLELDKRGGYILSYNGGNIVNAKTGEKLFAQFLPDEVIPILYRYAKEKNHALLGYAGNEIITEMPDDQYVKEESRINKMNIRKVENLFEALEPHPTKLLMTGDPADMLKAENELSEILGDRMDIFRSAPFFLELVPKGIDKAKSLLRLLSKINLTPADMIAFGDATSPRCGRSASFPACASSIAAAIISRGSTCANAPTCKSSIAATTKSRRSTSTACAGLRSWTVPKTCSHAST